MADPKNSAQGLRLRSAREMLLRLYRANGGRGGGASFKHVESDAAKGSDRKGLRSVVALKKRRDSKVDAVLELSPSAIRPPIRAMRPDEATYSCRFVSIRG